MLETSAPTPPPPLQSIYRCPTPTHSPLPSYCSERQHQQISKFQKFPNSQIRKELISELTIFKKGFSLRKEKLSFKREGEDSKDFLGKKELAIFKDALAYPFRVKPPPPRSPIIFPSGKRGHTNIKQISKNFALRKKRSHKT